MHLNWKASQGTKRIKEKQDKRKKWGRGARLDIKTKLQSQDRKSNSQPEKSHKNYYPNHYFCPSL